MSKKFLKSKPRCDSFIRRHICVLPLYLVMALILVFSALPSAVFAWCDYSQHKTNSLSGFPRPADQSLTVSKLVRNSDGSELSSDQLGQAFTFTVEFSDGGSYPYYIVTASPSAISVASGTPPEGDAPEGIASSSAIIVSSAGDSGDAPEAGQEAAQGTSPAPAKSGLAAPAHRQTLAPALPASASSPVSASSPASASIPAPTNPAAPFGAPSGEFAPFAAWNPVYAASILLGQTNSGLVQAASQTPAATSPTSATLPAMTLSPGSALATSAAPAQTAVSSVPLPASAASVKTPAPATSPISAASPASAQSPVSASLPASAQSPVSAPSTAPSASVPSPAPSLSPASSNSDGPAGEFAPFAAWNPVYAASVLLGQANSGQVQAGSQVDAIPAGSQTDAIPAGSQADAIPAGSQVDAVSADMINESVASGPGFSLEGAEAAASAGPETTSAGPEMASASAEPETASAAPAPEITPAPSDSRETSAANNLTHSPAPDGATEPASASGSQKQSGANRETQKPSGVRAADPENPGVGAQIAALDFSPIGFSPIGFSPIEGSVPPPEDLTAFASGGTIRLAHGQTAVFPYLPKGVGYTVTEAPADGYTADALGAVGIVGEPTDDGMFNTVIFVNTFDTGVTPPEETVAVSGEKTWVHNGNDPAGYPQSITVNILANGRIVRTYNVTEAKGWRWSAELPKYDAAGNEIIYTVGENPAPGYTSAVNGYNITNTYVGGEPQPTVTISGTKTWIGDSARTDRPGSITVYVLADGAIVKALTVGAGDNWRWSVEMPKYGGNGKEIVYTVGEAAVSGYTSATDGYNLINTFIGKQTPSPGPLPTGGSQGGQTYAPEYPTPGVSPSPTPGAEPTAATATPGPTPEPTPAETLTPSAAPPTATRLTSGGAIEIEVPSKPGSPKTGDEGNSPLWIVFMCVSAAGLISVWAWPRLRRQGKK